MRIQILSDLHVEFEGNLIPPLAPDAELIVLAGDLAPVHTRRVGDIAKRWAGADRILYVPGNHEFYGSDIEVARRELARQCLEHGVTGATGVVRTARPSHSPKGRPQTWRRSR